MPLSRLENFLINTDGNILYVNSSDLDATDSFDNKGNSLTRPFVTIQRALIEAARFAYQSGPNNDRFDKTTILLYPGTHYIDNRPGYYVKNNSGIAQYFDVNRSVVVSPDVELTNSSIFDLNDSNNVLYKFNSVEGGVIVPKGTSIVGLDLRKTKIRPLYVPDPEDSSIDRSSIFRVTGGCYFWQFSVFDADRAVFYNKNYSQQASPFFSHHKLTVFEYADGINTKDITGLSDLSMYYYKLMNAYGDDTGNREIVDYPSSTDFEPNSPEFKIVGDLSANDIRISALSASANVADVTTSTTHGLSVDDSIRIAGVSSSLYNGSFKVTGITSETKFSYTLPTTPIDTSITISSNERVVIEPDNVNGASPYIFNCSLRSSFGMCGLHADGSKATGFKSMVVAQFTGIGLQKDDNAFIIYNEITGLYDTNSTTALANRPLHINQNAIYKSGYESYHIKASNDAVIQDVSVFAIGFAQHFVAEKGADQSITNSNSNFGAKSLISKGFRKESFDRDDTGYITHIVPPKDLQENSFNVLWKTLDIGLTTSYTGIGSTARLYLLSEKDFTNPPSNITNGYRVGSKINEKLYLTVNIGGTDFTYSSPILMQSPLGDGPTSEKIFTVTQTAGINNIDISNDILTLNKPHNLFTGESVRVYSDNGILPEPLENGQLYYAINTTNANDNNANDKIKLAKTINNANDNNPVDIKNKNGGIISIVSRVTDKLPGEVGHPVQYDSSNNNWYILSSSSTTTNKIYEALKNNSSIISSNNSSTFIQRSSENRDLIDRIYKLRYVIPKNWTNPIAKAPEKNYILQESKTVLEDSVINTINSNRNPHIISGITTSGSTVTVTSEKPHRLSAGDVVRISKVKSSTNTSATDNKGFNGFFNVVSVPTSKTFTFTNTNNGGTFFNNISERDSNLPVFARNEYDTTYIIQSVETIQEYVSDLQDGIYYITCLIGNISPTVSDFSNQKFKQNIEYLYPTIDKDNPNNDPLQSVSVASNKVIGKVIVNDSRNSITKESIVNYIKDNRIGFAVTWAVGSSSGISTLYSSLEHNLNKIINLSIVNSGSGYGSGISSTLYNVPLVGDGINGQGATANVTVSAAGTITSVSIVDGGSAYSVGNVLTVGNGGTGIVSVTSINNNVGDVIQVIGVGTVGNRNNGTYNGLYKITSIPTPKSVTYNVGANPGIYTSSSGIFLIVDKALSITNIAGIANTNVSGIVTVTTLNSHGLSVGNRIKINGISGTASTIFNDDFIVQKKVSLKSFTIKPSIGISTTGIGSAEVYKYGISSFGQDSSLKNEKISGSLLNLNAGINTTTSSDITTIETTLSLTNTDGFYKGDFIQIDDEIIRIISVNENNKLSVLRGVLGTKSSSHDSGSVVRSIKVIPSEVRRSSSIRASGHTFEYLGYGPGNYSTALPQRQKRSITLEEELLSISKEEKGGVVFYSGMNDRGDFFIGERMTARENFLGQVTSDSTASFDEVYIRNTLRVGGGSNRNLPSEFRGPVSFTNKISSTSSDGIEAIKLLLKGNSIQNPFFQIGPDSNPSFVIDELSQNIGVKNPNPLYDLDVNGSIRANVYENFKFSDLPNTKSKETTFAANRILKVNDGGSGYELVDFHELNTYMLRSFGVSNDATVYVGIGSTVSNKLQISGISTSKFYVGDKVKLIGVTESNDNTLIDPPIVASSSAVKVGASSTVSTYRYWISQYNYRNGKVGVSSQIPPLSGIGMTSIDNFNDIDHISLNLARTDIDHGILIYRQEGLNTNINNSKLVAILGPKELTNQTSGIVWKDYGTYEQTEWSSKGSLNEYSSNQIHFPNNATTEHRRGWAIGEIISIGQSSITLSDNYKTNIGIGTTSIVKVVHDNTYALNEAINSIQSVGGNYLTLSSGTYLTQNLIIPTNFTLRGNGKNTVIKRQYFANDFTDGGENFLNFDGNFIGIGTTNATNVTIENLTIDGNFENNILFSGEIDNYLVYLSDMSSSLIRDVEIRNSPGHGLYVDNSNRLSIENCTFVDGCITDRYVFGPLSANNSQSLRINDCLFENYPGPVDLSASSVVSTGGNIIRNCGTGLRIYAAGKITTTNNIILGPSDEYIPSPDIYDSDFNSINITIDRDQTFTGPVLQYLENGEPKDISSTQVSIISAGIGTIVNQGTTNETLGTRFLNFNITTPDTGTYGRRNGYIQLSLTSSQTNNLGLSSALGYNIIAKEYLEKPVGFATFIGIGTGVWNIIGAGATQYTVTLNNYEQFSGISTGDVVKLVNHSVSPDLSSYELTVAEKINISSFVKKLRLTGITTTSITNGNQSGYISIRNTFTIAKGRVGVI
jgi:hypothetical protein